MLAPYGTDPFLLDQIEKLQSHLARLDQAIVEISIQLAKQQKKISHLMPDRSDDI